MAALRKEIDSTVRALSEEVCELKSARTDLENSHATHIANENAAHHEAVLELERSRMAEVPLDSIGRGTPR